MDRFEVKRVPIETSESGVNTSFEESVVPSVTVEESDVQEQGDVEEEEVITPRIGRVEKKVLIPNEHRFRLNSP